MVHPEVGRVDRQLPLIHKSISNAILNFLLTLTQHFHSVLYKIVLLRNNINFFWEYYAAITSDSLPNHSFQSPVSVNPRSKKFKLGNF